MSKPTQQAAKRYDARALKAGERNVPQLSAAIMAVATPVCIALGVYHDLTFLWLWPFAYAMSLIAWNGVLAVMPDEIGMGWGALAAVSRVASDMLFASIVLYCMGQDILSVIAFGLLVLILGMIVNFSSRRSEPIMFLRDRLTYGAIFGAIPVGFWLQGMSWIEALLIGWVSLVTYLAFVYAHSRATLPQVRPEVETRDLQQQKLEALGQLTGGVAHDFNNLLTVIMGNLDLLRAAPDNDQSDELLAEIDDAAHRASALTSQLLSFARKQDLAPQVTQAHDILASGLALLRRLLPATHNLDVIADHSCPTIFVDRPNLQTVLVNLLINARDAMPSGGTIRLSLRGQELTAGNRPKGTENLPDGLYMVIAIRDTGQGISDADMARVLEPFYTTKGKGRGSGLGLSSALGFVEQTGGALSLSSTPGIGTRAALWFPAYEPQAVTS